MARRRRSSAPVVHVEDPETGKTIHLVYQRHPRTGTEFLRRLPDSNYDVSQRSPRQLEATAAFGEIASGAYGKRSSPTEPAAAREVRERMPLEFPSEEDARGRRARERQEEYRGLAHLTPEDAALLDTVDGAEVHRVAPGRRRFVPITERDLTDPEGQDSTYYY